MTPKPKGTMHQNLGHVLANDCTDPDCELHNPEVAVEEEVADETALAWFYAGAMWALSYTNSAVNEILDEMPRELRKKLNLHI